MGGSNNVNGKANRVGSYQIQSSAYGNPIPWGCGRGRVDINLIFLDGYQSHEHTQHSGGKGGGNSTNDTYTYTADILLGISDTLDGPIRGINAIFRDKSVFSGFSDGSEGEDENSNLCVKRAGFSNLRNGNSGQAPVDTLTNNYPDKALGYDTISYLVGSQYSLNDQGGLQNHSVEADFHCQVGGGIVDANPGDYGGTKGIVHTFLTAMIPQWDAAFIGDLTDYGTYCLASGLLLSPVLDSQQQASSVIDEIMLASNSECWIRGDGTLQVKPRADAPVTGNGVTYTPDLTPLYDLGDDDFIVDNPDDDPVKIDTGQLDDLYNIVQVAYKSRQHQYNDETATGFDQASIDDIGQRKQDPTQIASIKDPIVARLVAQILAQRYSSVARPFTFNLPWCFARLEEMDTVTVTNESQGLDRVLSRITEIDKDGDTGKLTVKAIEVLVGTANAPVYPSQTANGVVTDFEADPGNVNVPALFIPPTTITNGDLEAWAAVSSTNTNWGGADVWIAFDDGTGHAANYTKVGTVQGSARYGVTTTDLPSHSDPDTVNSLGVDLSISAGVLLPGTQADVDALATLCWLGGELIAYLDADLGETSNTYTLGGELRRGAYGSIIEDHPAGTPFIRLDTSVFKFSFLTGQLGKTIHIKFLSFNIFGNNVQKLEDVVDYTLVLTQPGTLPGASALSLQSPWVGTQFTLVASAASGALDYIFRIYAQDGVTIRRQTAATPSLSFTYTADMAIADGSIDRTYRATVQAVNSAGDGPESAQLNVTNAAPAAATGVGKTGTGGSVTINWTANTETDRAGYVAWYSQTTGFDPTIGQGAAFYEGPANTAPLSGLTVGQTYYVRVAAFDTWSDDARFLNFSAQFGFTA